MIGLNCLREGHLATALRLLRAVAFALGLVCMTAPARAGLDEGMDAYNRQDWIAAYQEFKPLADSGEPVAQYFLASMYFNGWGVPKNDQAMVRLFRASAEAGVPMAQFLYGVLHLAGERGVAKSEIIAVRWIRLAANQGVLPAMDQVGTFYRKGTVYDVNLVEACAWYESAALLGYPNSPGKCARIAKESNLTNNQITTAMEMAKERAKKVGSRK